MHSCLRIADIVLLICEQISDIYDDNDNENGSDGGSNNNSDDDTSNTDSDDSGSELKNYMKRIPLKDSADPYAFYYHKVQSRSSQLFALAQTCRHLHQPALQSLWSTIDSIAPILQCIGGDLVKKKWDSKVTLQLTRPISPSEAKTMMKYAAFVRHLNMKAYSRGVNTWAALEDTFPQTTLFPNLQTITLTDVTMACDTLFGIQGLTSLTIAAQIHQSSMLVECSAQCPGLRSLQLNEFPEPDGLRAFAEALLNWPNLSSFSTCRAATPEIIQMVSRCPRLKSIEFGGIKWKPYPVEGGFPMLGRVVISDGTMANVISFLDVLPAASNIRTLALQRLYSDVMPLIEGKYWLYLLQSIKKYAHSLKELSLVEHPRKGLITDSGVLSNALLSNLAAFTVLTHVKIACSGDHSFDDEGVKMLTEALPQLEDFCLSVYVRPGNGLSYEPHTTILCLTYFAQNCPQLKDLVIAFNAATKKCPKYPELPTQGLKLTSLGVSISPIAHDLDELADFILRVFLNIKWLDWEKYPIYFDLYPLGSKLRDQEVNHMIRWSTVSRTLERKLRI